MYIDFSKCFREREKLCIFASARKNSFKKKKRERELHNF